MDAHDGPARARTPGAAPTHPSASSEDPGPGSRGPVSLRALRRSWSEDLGRDERAAILAWGSFTLTFGGVRALTHWIRDGHGPSSGGMSLGGFHFHHYNLGILGLAALGGLVVQAEAREQIGDHPALPVAYGLSTALIADEAALLLELQDVYWSPQGRQSVEIATGVIGAGGFAIAAAPLLVRARRRTKG